MRRIQIACPNCGKIMIAEEGRPSLMCDGCRNRIKITPEMFEEEFAKQENQDVDLRRESEIEADKTTDWERYSLLWGYGAIAAYVLILLSGNHGFLSRMQMWLAVLYIYAGGIYFWIHQPKDYEKAACGLSSPLSKKTALIICLVAGTAGAHYFYTGRRVTGILYAMTGGFLLFGVIKDLLLILSGKFVDKEGRYLN